MKNKKIYFTLAGILVLCIVAFITVPTMRKMVSEKFGSGDRYVSQICAQLNSESSSVFIMENKDNVVGGYYAVAGKRGEKNLSLYLYNAQGTQIAYTGTTDSTELKANFLKTYHEFGITNKVKKEVVCK
jgi:hypothetical protein